MTHSICTRCGREIPDGGPPGLCPHCLLRLGINGHPDPDSLADTGLLETTDFSDATPPGSLDHSMFFPGQRLLDRYRIVCLLGRGGMGEVYRADDFKLGESIALKFLPQELQRDPPLLRRLLKEAKTARRVSHPNVCRVFDIGEVNGRLFISMEYVDGEDLQSLLHRVGRLPQDKALQLARQLCAGLAAAHGQGILHRDIKPANIMIDGHGRVRITDFGLAEIAESLLGPRACAGTPAYMAPEQLSGQKVTARSDIYALGVVLYEMFTAHRPFPDNGLKTTPIPPSQHVPGLHPTTQAVILSCLYLDPERRPASALAVAAALPGSHPLEHALASGETPLPETIAAASVLGGLRRRVAWPCVIAIVVGLIFAIQLSSKTQVTRIVPLEKSTDVLSEKARGIIMRLGYEDAPADSVHGFSYDVRYLMHIEEDDASPNRWNRLKRSPPSTISFWYRQGPTYLVPWDLAQRHTSYDDPPLIVPGMVGIRLDSSGRLREFDAVPPRFGEPGRPDSELDWNVLFEEAELDIADFEPVEPTWTPVAYAQERRAWIGHYPASPALDVRVEAASGQGRVVGFRVIDPWMGRVQPHASSLTPIFSAVRFSSVGGGAWAESSRLVFMVSLIAAMIGGAVVARRNLRMGRGHHKGAFRLASFLMVTGMLIWLFGAHHVPTADELRIFVVALAVTLFWSIVAWVLYIALEPYVRRIWPRTLVSWIRLLDGHLRDPLVGRHVLAGCVIGTALFLVLQLYQVVPEWVGIAPPRPDRINVPTNELEALRGFRHSVAVLMTVLWVQTFYLLLYTCVLMMIRLLFRRDWLTILLFVVLGALLANPAAGNPIGDLVLAVFLTGSGLFAFFRFGLLSVVVALIVSHLPGAVTMTFDLSAWYAHGSVLAMLILLGLVSWALHSSLAGKSLFGDALLRD